MVDPLGPQHVERLGHVVRRSLFGRVGDQPQAFGRRAPVHVLEQRRRVADLGRVEPDADELVAERQRGPQGVAGRVRAEVAQETQDQVGGQVSVGERGGQPREHRPDRHPVAGVRLRVEEDLRPPHPGRGGPGQVGAGQVVEVLLGAQHQHARVVQIEKRLQAAEAVPGPQLADVRSRQRHPVACGEPHEQLGLKRALDVKMKLGDRQHAAILPPFRRAWSSPP